MKRMIPIAAFIAVFLAGCSWFQPLDRDGMVYSSSPDSDTVTETTADSTESSTSGSYLQITQDEAKEMMSRDDGHIILDVRRQDEFDSGHIPGAVLIPNEDIGTERPPQLPDTEQIILVYCRSGRRSKEAAQKLADMGYTNIYEFGGINTWTGEVVTEDK